MSEYERYELCICPVHKQTLSRTHTHTATLSAGVGGFFLLVRKVALPSPLFTHIQPNPLFHLLSSLFSTCRLSFAVF